MHPVLKALIENLFDEMLLTFGKKFVDQWSAAEPDKLVEHWGRELTGFTPRELRRGVETQKTLDWPPTLAQFKKLCRPSIDPETAYYEALNQGIAREAGQPNVWSSPAIYWAWRSIGAYDFRSLSYPALKGRWERVLADEVSKGQWEPVPVTAVQIGMNRKATAMSARGTEELTKAISSVMKAPLSGTDHLRWARKIDEKVRSGDKSVPILAAKMAREALGIVRS